MRLRQAARQECQQAQGYLYSRAMSANDAIDFIRKQEKDVAPTQAHVAQSVPASALP
jgi:hypothetical protein